MFTYNKWHFGIPGQRDASVGGKLDALGRVTDAEFEVIEPTTEQHGTEQSAGDGIQYEYTGADRPAAGTGTGIGGHAFGTFTTT